MKCQENKVAGKKWSMRYEELGQILMPCTYPAKFLVIVTKNKKSWEFMVCGTHKNSIINHSKKVGSIAKIQEIK